MSDIVQAKLSAADFALGRSNWQLAITQYRDALKMDAGNAVAWFNLAFALRATRAFEPALAAYQQAIDLGISGAEEAHINRAAVYSEYLAAPDAAMVELNLALTRNPHSVTALLNLGVLLEDAGDSTAADACYAQVRQLDPLNGRALLRQTMIAIHENRVAALVPDIEATITRPDLDLDTVADLNFAHANALDTIGHHAEAWEAMLRANAADAAATPPALRYNPAAHEKLVESLMTAGFGPSADSMPIDASAPELIFICGLFRSGSTLAEQILARHREVTAGGELELIPALIADCITNYPSAVVAASDDLLGQWRTFYVQGLAAMSGDARFLTDKRCDNFLHIGLIKALFPRAKIVHTIRNPADTLISTLFLRFGHAVSYGSSPQDFDHWHTHYTRLMEHWTNLYGADIITLDYDQLVASPTDVIAKLLSDLALPWDEGCLGHHEAGPVHVRTASSWQVRQPVHQRSSGRARAYGAMLDQLRVSSNN